MYVYMWVAGQSEGIQEIEEDSARESLKYSGAVPTGGVTRVSLSAGQWGLGEIGAA